MIPEPASGFREVVLRVTLSVPSMNEVTQILNAIAEGDPSAASQLLPLVYDELRKLAAHRLAHQPPGQTLQPTALVHEAYLRLVGDPEGSAWDNRGHFFAACAEAMRRILVENARRKGRLKRGGGLARLDLGAAEQVTVPEVREDLLALDEALTRLASADPEAAKLVQLRYFAGLSIPEAARALSVSPRTADRLWAFARVWLLREVGGDVTGGQDS
jgi:RNA polymerase sigma factor (TIGR02999 family)